MSVSMQELFSLFQRHFGTWVYTFQPGILNYSPAWLGNILATDESEIRSPRAFLRLVHVRDRAKLIKKLRLLCHGDIAKIECELRLVCADTTNHRIEIRAIAAERDEHGIATCICGTTASVHARTLQEEALYDLCQKLQSSETRYRALLNDAKSPIIVMDADSGTIEDVNNAASTVTGYPRAELFSMVMRDLVEMAEGESYVGKGRRDDAIKERNLKCKSGMQIAVEISCSNVSVQDRNLTQCIIHDVSLRKRTEATLRHMASHDPLTGLPNRNLLAEHLEKAMHNAGTHGHIVAVCFVDLNKFKEINDVFGHDVGDTILKNFAARLMGAIRKSDTAARLGGDEFIFILEELPDSAAATKVVKKIIQRLNIPYGVEGRSIDVHCSIGISIYPHTGSTPLELLQNADKAMYHAKKNALDYYLWPEGKHTEEATG
ncbi:MAG: diguanylate cyclase domain-containing protein [Desulfuromonadaceae bacterium]|nr:diguanylate cyclase [Geobacteraceae bacterium]